MTIGEIIALAIIGVCVVALIVGSFFGAGHPLWMGNDDD